MKALFDNYTSKEMYEKDNLKWVEPMLAKEIEDEAKQDECFNSEDYFIEEKFDGTRATLHFFKDFARCFSRRVSNKTNWFCENSDSVPHIRDLAIPELEGTIIDGEMFIPNRPFKDVASTLNCKWDKAVERQEELGKIVFHAFDIMYYKGIRVEKMPLHRRKEYLKKVIDTVNSEYIELVTYQKCGNKVSTIPYEEVHGNLSEVFNNLGEKGRHSYPNFYEEMKTYGGNFHSLSPRAFYEYIVATGGEGVILKPINGKYYYKRGWEYSKVKKFLTKDVIILRFSEPTSEYKGKFPTIDKWDYWETNEHDIVDLSLLTPDEIETFKKNWYPDECAPISKFYAEGWIGNIVFGVTIEPEELFALKGNRKNFIDKKYEVLRTDIEGEDKLILVVGECGGFDEEMRQYFTNNARKLIGTVIEVKANELFKDTGKMRHPRFLRMRPDKSAISCTWEDHIL